MLFLSNAFFDVGGTLGSIREGQRLEPFPDTAEILRVFSGLGLKLGVITNVPSSIDAAAIHRMLAAAGLGQYFELESITTSIDAGYPKPHPKIFEAAALRARASLSSCLYVSEDQAEVAGARASGMCGIVKPPNAWSLSASNRTT